LEQAKALDSFLSSKKIEITATIGLEADDEILIQRIIEREEKQTNVLRIKMS
jgi:adenylate kinase